MEIEVLNKKNNYYELYHVYEDKALGDKVVKFIGLFSSTQNAWKAIKALRHQPDRKSTRLNSSHSGQSRMPSSA